MNQFHHQQNARLDITRANDALQRVANLGQTATIKIPSFSPPANYESWIPIRGYVFAQLDPPYLLYKGDTTAHGAQSEQLFNNMCEEYEKHTGIEVLPLSDGELDSDGRLCKKKHSTRIYAMNRQEYSLPSIRLRAAQRHAILTVTELHGDRESVYKLLATALNIKSWQRVRAYRDIALKRATQEQVRKDRVHKLQSQADNIYEAIVKPVPTDGTPLTKAPVNSPEFYYHAQYPAALQYFCKQCSTFLCGLHDGNVMVPRQPIPDPSCEDRIAKLESYRIDPNARLEKHGLVQCSRKCFLLPKSRQDPIDAAERTPWTSEELSLLLEATLIFQRDPCKLACVVGTKTCRQVCIQIQNKRQWITCALNAASKERTVSMQTVFKGPSERTPRKNRAQKSTKSSTRKIGGETNFIPCDHEGPCTEEVCPCIRRHRYCETRCGCHHDRYCEKEGKIVSVLQTCGQTQSMCDCVGGACSTNSCSCRENGVACVPGACGCDAGVLPSDVRAVDRKCRNSDFIVGRHKRTLVAKSNVDGFGLFAGCDFLEGEVVGLYDGVLWSSDLVEAATAVGEDRKRTFTFNLTKDHDVDATLMGSKVRFANHGKAPERRNCEAKELFIRGEICMALITTRPVKAGEEFLFDYQLTVGEDWFKDMK